MTDANDETSSREASSSIAAWRQWRVEDEGQARAFGDELRAIVDPGRWPVLSVEARRELVEAARRWLHQRLDLVRETWLEWNDSDDPGLGYDEETGAIHVPSHHLETADPKPLVGGLAEEVRHAWQFDIIEERLDHPLGPIGKERLAEAYANYNAASPAAYSANELEMDAQDFAAHLVAGYRG